MKRLLLLSFILYSTYTLSQEKLIGVVQIDMASSSDNNSPGITVKINDDFLYDGKYLNHYGIGFHDFQDISSPLNGRNAYVSGYFGIDFFTGGKNRLRINSNGNVGIGNVSPSCKLDINGNVKANALLLNDPNSTNDWNAEWQCGFFDGYNIPNAPEANQWYWGVNLGHRSNRSDYRYGGQVLIKNSSSPVLYFRSRNKDGVGTWAKVLHNIGDQKIGGNLTVDGAINSEEIKVEDIVAISLNLSGGLAANNIIVKANGQTADFVFSDDYQLKDLSEVETFIKENKHLPDIPSAAEMEEQGVNLAEMNKLLLQKMEELTLYAIELEKARRTEQGARENLELKVETLTQRLEKIETLLTNDK